MTRYGLTLRSTRNQKSLKRAWAASDRNALHTWYLHPPAKHTQESLRPHCRHHSYRSAHSAFSQVYQTIPSSVVERKTSLQNIAETRQHEEQEDSLGFCLPLLLISRAFLRMPAGTPTRSGASVRNCFKLRKTAIRWRNASKTPSTLCISPLS